MKHAIIISIRILLVFTLLTGALYPGLVWVIGQSFFPKQANGSLVSFEGNVVGSSLIGQAFEQEGFFHSRFSASGFGTTPAGATNFGPTNLALRKTIQENRQGIGLHAPTDFITSSASGLDPHISVEAAMMQVDRVAKASTSSLSDRSVLTGMIRQATEAPTFGLLGRRRVNVLSLNILLMEYLRAHPG